MSIPMNMRWGDQFNTDDDLFSDMLNRGQYFYGGGMLMSLVDGDNIIVANYDFARIPPGPLTATLDAPWNTITFKNCSFDSKLIFIGEVRNVVFENVTFSQSFQLRCSCESITIKNSLTPFVLEIEGEVSKSISVTQANLINMEVQHGSEHIALQEVTCEKDVTLKSSIALMHFVQLKCNCLLLNLAETMLCSIRSCSVINTISFYGSELLSTMDIQDSELHNLDLCLLNKAGSVTISNSKILVALKINFQQAIRRVVVKNKCIINVLYVSGTVANDAVFRITEALIYKFTFEDFKNAGNCSFAEIQLSDRALLVMKHSNFGKAEFHNNNFTKANFEFTKSVISEVFVSGTDFPLDIYSHNKIDHGQAKLAFGQLQTVFQKQGDSVRSYEYLSREVKAYYQEQKLNRKNVFTIFNLWLNKVSNDFGRNWAQGFIFSFAAGLLFFYLLILSSREFTFAFPITIDWNYTAAFFKFMNPLRHFETENLFKIGENTKLHITPTNLSYAIDFFGRVIVAYGYYQTIQAFRKFGRK